MQSWIFGIRSRPFVLLAALFVVLTVLVYYEVTDGLDRGVSDAFSDGIIGNPVADTAMQYITETGDALAMLLFGVLMLLIRRTRRIGITLMLLLVISTLLTGYIKCGIDRDRPDLTYDGTPFPVEISSDTYALFCDGSFTASYPSGHAARTVIFAIVLGYALSHRFPNGAYLMFLYPALVSLSRIYVLQHYPMDIIAGTVLGIMLAGSLSNRTKLYKIFGRSEP